ncbi:hypothetical protein HRG_012440 [Hirsutella rhossiliensis]
MNRQPGGERKRKGRTPGGQALGKCSRVRVGQKTPRRRELQAEDLASVLQHLEEEFAAGEGSQTSRRGACRCRARGRYVTGSGQERS